MGVFIFAISIKESKNFEMLWIELFIAALFIYQYKKAKKDRLFVYISNYGLQLERNEFIKWLDVITAYVEIHSNSEGPDDCYLYIYHKANDSNEFLLTDYKFETKGMKYNDICFFINYWLQKNNIITKEQPN